MPQLLIRDLEPSTVKRLKLRAKQHYRSLQGELKFIVESAVKMTMKEAIQMSEKWRKNLSETSFSDSVELQREDRNR